MTRLAIVAALLLALTSTGYAQEDDEEPAPQEELAEPDVETQQPSAENVLMADLSLGVVSIGIEHMLDAYVSFQIAAGIYGPWYETDGVLGVGGELRLFAFLQGEAPFGIYLSPGVRGAVVFTEDEDRLLTGGAFSVRMSWGYSFDFSPVVLRLGAGAQYHIVEIEAPRNGPSESFSTVYPVVDIYLGWAF